MRVSVTASVRRLPEKSAASAMFCTGSKMLPLDRSGQPVSSPSRRTIRS